MQGGSTRKSISAAPLKKPEVSQYDSLLGSLHVGGEGCPSNLTCIFPAGFTVDTTTKPRLGVPEKRTVILLLQINR